MPVITRRQPLLDLRGKTTSIALSDTLSFQSSGDEDNTHSWLFSETHFPTPQKEMDFPPPSLRQKSLSRSNLRLTTQSSLHSRYQSSEEEASPSPDDYPSSSDECTSTPLKPESLDRDLDLDTEPPALSDTDSSSDYEDSTPSTPIFLATSLTFINAGRPRLISISSLAPIQKRKRSIPTPITATPIQFSKSSQPSPISTSSAYHSAPTSPPPRAAKRPVYTVAKERAKAAPEVWLPYDCDEDNSSENEAERLMNSACEDDLATLVNASTSTRSLHSPGEIYFPPEQCSFSSQLDSIHHSPTPTTYAEYDPYSLDPPRLSIGGGDLAYARKYGGVSAEKVVQKRGWKGILGKGKGRKGSGNGFDVGMERGRMGCVVDMGRGWAFED